MKLSEIVSAAPGLAIYAEIALVLFLIAFVAVIAQVTSKTGRSKWQGAEALPLDESDDVSMNTTKVEPR